MGYVFLLLYILFFVFIIVICSRKSLSKKVVLDSIVSKKYEDLALNVINASDELKVARGKFKFYSHISYGCLLAFFGLIVLRMTGVQIPFFALFSILCIVLFIVFIFVRKDSTLFDVIVKNVVSEYNKDLTYDHSKGINSAVYREARFEGYDRYHSDDLITGDTKIGKFEMGEVHTEREHRDKDGHTHYTTVFHGTFAKLNLSKPFSSNLMIVNNRIKLFNRDQYITIDNEEFEKIYDVFTDDKIKAMRLLTPDVTTKMIDLYNKTGLYFELKIFDNNLYIRLYTGALFSFSFSNPSKEAKQIGSSIAMIDNVFTIMNNIVDELERFDV